MYERRKNPCAEFCLMDGWLWHIDHVFKHKPTAVPLEDELTLPTRGARFTLFFVVVNEMVITSSSSSRRIAESGLAFRACETEGGGGA
jgi:hypothetical protein